MDLGWIDRQTDIHTHTHTPKAILPSSRVLAIDRHTHTHTPKAINVT